MTENLHRQCVTSWRREGWTSVTGSSGSCYLAGVRGHYCHLTVVPDIWQSHLLNLLVITRCNHTLWVKVRVLWVFWDLPVLHLWDSKLSRFSSCWASWFSLSSELVWLALGSVTQRANHINRHNNNKTISNKVRSGMANLNLAPLQSEGRVVRRLPEKTGQGHLRPPGRNSSGGKNN